MITVEQALETILGHIRVLGAERVDILKARGPGACRGYRIRP